MKKQVLLLGLGLVCLVDSLPAMRGGSRKGRDETAATEGGAASTEARASVPSTSPEVTEGQALAVQALMPGGAALDAHSITVSKRVAKEDQATVHALRAAMETEAWKNRAMGAAVGGVVVYGWLKYSTPTPKPSGW